MGDRGKARAPTNIAKLRGYRPSRINENEPKPPPLEHPPRCPLELKGRARTLFRKLSRELWDRRLLTEWDVPLLKSWCILEQQEHEAYRDWAKPVTIPLFGADGAVVVDAGGRPQLVEIAPAFSATVPGYRGTRVANPALATMRSAAAGKLPISKRFGFTPSDRAGIEMPEIPDDDAEALTKPKRITDRAGGARS